MNASLSENEALGDAAPKRVLPFRADYIDDSYLLQPPLRSIRLVEDDYRKLGVSQPTLHRWKGEVRWNGDEGTSSVCLKRRP